MAVCKVFNLKQRSLFRMWNKIEQSLNTILFSFEEFSEELC